MTLEELRARLAEIPAELDALNDIEDDEARTARFNELEAEFEDVTGQVRRQERIAEIRTAAAKEGQTQPGDTSGNTRRRPVVTDTDPYEIDEARMATGMVPVTELRDRALRAIDASDVVDAEGKTKAETLIRRYDNRHGDIARRVLLTGHAAYQRAFQKYVAGLERAWTPEERAAVARAASLTDASGGFAVPFPIDPTLILTNTGSANPFRQISRVVPITTDSWQGISAGAVAASWDGEAVAVSDDTPTWTQPQVPVHKAQAFVPYSIEIGQDYPGFVDDMRLAIAEGKDELEGAAFATGSGTNQPTGIVTALTGTGSVQASGTTDIFTVPDDLSATVENLRAKSRGRAVWTGNLATYNQIREDTANTDAVWATTAAGIPDQLYGRPAYESSDMDGVINTTVDNYLLVFGDFSRYLIADRVGLSVEAVPHLFDTTDNRPTGSRGLYAYWRVGGDSIDDGAFSMLNVT